MVLRMCPCNRALSCRQFNGGDKGTQYTYMCVLMYLMQGKGVGMLFVTYKSELRSILEISDPFLLNFMQDTPMFYEQILLYTNI